MADGATDAHAVQAGLYFRRINATMGIHKGVGRGKMRKIFDASPEVRR